MNFSPGDWVVHCSHGLGKVISVEERSFDKYTALFYMVQIGDLTIWVPSDDNLSKRLRRPINADGFKKLFATLSSKPEELPTDRRQRNQYLSEMLKDGSAESLCRVIRDLAAHRKHRSWSEYDSDMMRRTQKSLIGEWSFIFSILPHEAESELQKLLTQNAK